VPKAGALELTSFLARDLVVHFGPGPESLMAVATGRCLHCVTSAKRRCCSSHN
jgi:hypothetical protein